MELNIREFKKNNSDIFPVIDELVNSLYMKELNELIDTKCKTVEDKRVFLMFLIIYFYSYLNVPEEIKKNDNYDLKSELKIFLSDIIKNPEKRHKGVDLYMTFEKSINYLKN
jgi:hypothetical protein